MPPPKRRKKDPRPSMSVYPPRRAGVALGGYRSTTFTQAIRCWVKLMEPACVAVQSALKPAEWNYLALACQGREHELDPDDDNPGDLLAQRVASALAYAVGTDLLDGKRAQQLAEKLRGLDYLHAWAVIWAVQWRCDFLGSDGALGEGEEWWTLAHRRKHLEEQP